MKEKNIIQLSLAEKRFSTKEYTFTCSLNTKELKSRIEFILRLVNTFSCSLSIRFCNSEEMALANKEFAGKAGATDVLSFSPLPELQYGFTGEPLTHLGDILICIPYCWNNSNNSQSKFIKYLDQSVLHGIVHLKGFDHVRSEFAHATQFGLERKLATLLNQSLGQPAWFNIVRTPSKE